MVNVFAHGFAVDKQSVAKIVDERVRQHGIGGQYEVNVNFISESQMIKLHDKKPHLVLAYPLDKEMGPDGVTRLGDIVVLGQLPRQKRDALVKHGCLHLLGIHHH